MNQIPDFPEGSGFFETMLTRRGEVAELNRHMRRAVKTSQALAIAIPGEDEIRRRITESIQNDNFEYGRLRIAFSHNSFFISHSSYEPQSNPLRLTFHPQSATSEGEQWKTFPYTPRFAIVNQALNQGFDDAIVFNRHNNVTETGLSNIAFLIDDKWITPPISAGILPGVMRAIAIERSGVMVRDIHISEISLVRSAVLLSSLKIAHPVSHIGDFQLELGDEVAALTADIATKLEYFSIG